MTREANEVDQAVSRTLRDNLEKLQRMTDELNHAVNDVTSACASARPSNTLSPILRAQSAAASLAASLEVLSRFVAATLQPGLRAPIEQEASPAPAREPAPIISEPLMESQPLETVEELRASEMIEEGAPIAAAAGPGVGQFPEQLQEPVAEPSSFPVEELPPAAAAFEISALSMEEQELHKRANRVAKVSMQDIKMLRPNEVKLGKENKDLCQRLRDDIEKAHKEYDRRFQTILGHPVDYFYDWMVEILGEGDPQALGVYPYPSPVLRR